MSHPSDAEQQRLATIADEVREQLGSEGHLVAVAVRLHGSFTNSRRPGCDLAREMIMQGARRGAHKAGAHPESVSGGGLDILSPDGATYRRYRLKQGTKLADGSYKMIHNGDSALIPLNDDLFQSERWVLGYTLDDDFQVGEIFAAEVLGVEDRKPGRLILGETLMLSATSTPPPWGFTSTDEDLDDLGDEEEDETGEEGLGDAS